MNCACTKSDVETLGYSPCGFHAEKQRRAWQNGYESAAKAVREGAARRHPEVAYGMNQALALIESHEPHVEPAGQ